MTNVSMPKSEGGFPRPEQEHLASLVRRTSPPPYSRCPECLIQEATRLLHREKAYPGERPTPTDGMRALLRVLKVHGLAKELRNCVGEPT